MEKIEKLVSPVEETLPNEPVFMRDHDATDCRNNFFIAKNINLQYI